MKYLLLLLLSSSLCAMEPVTKKFDKSLSECKLGNKDYIIAKTISKGADRAKIEMHEDYKAAHDLLDSILEAQIQIRNDMKIYATPDDLRTDGFYTEAVSTLCSKMDEYLKLKQDDPESIIELHEHIFKKTEEVDIELLKKLIVLYDRETLNELYAERDQLKNNEEKDHYLSMALHHLLAHEKLNICKNLEDYYNEVTKYSTEHNNDNKQIESLCKAMESISEQLITDLKRELENCDYVSPFEACRKYFIDLMRPLAFGTADDQTKYTILKGIGRFEEFKNRIKNQELLQKDKIIGDINNIIRCILDILIYL